MADLAGKPLLWHVLERIKRSKHIDEIVLATTTKSEDDILIQVANGRGIHPFRGAENGLVDRCYQAAKAYHADIVVRKVHMTDIIAWFDSVLVSEKQTEILG